MLKVIYLLSFFLFAYGFQDYGNYQFQVRKSPKLNQAEAFMQAAQTGNKASFNYHNKNLLKRFGLLHLLTPSGLHLSSILGLMLIFLPRKFHIVVFVVTLAFFINNPALYSLKRVLYFQIIRYFCKSSKLSFLMAFFVDYITGGFYKSVLSYAYSFLFWGVIIFSPKNYWILCKNLFIAQLVAINFNQDSINFFTLIINPVFTSLYSTLFPLMSLNYWLLDIAILKDAIIKFHHMLLELLWYLDQQLKIFELRPHFVFFALPFLSGLKIHYYLILLVIPFELNKTSLHKPGLAKVFYPLKSNDEMMSSDSKKIHFVGLNCRKKFKENYWDFYCKKKPSKNGGPWR
jgi:hypothetical protein